MKIVVVFIIVAPGLSIQHSDSNSDELDGSHEYDHQHQQYTLRRSHKHSSKKHTRDCVCDCQRCDKLQQCCELFCKECDQSEQKNDPDTQPGLSSGNLVFVPYPYPMMVPPPVMPPIPIPMPHFNFENITSTTPSTSSSTSPSTHRCNSLSRCSERKQADVENDAVLDLLQSLRRRQEYTNVNLRPVKRSQIQDYDEISNQLLDRLIMQRNVKDINSG